MGWSLGYDNHWARDIGHGVPAFCDHPGCGREIDRGLGCVCGGEPRGGEKGCGLYFCGHHLTAAGPQRCERCTPRVKKPFAPTFDHPSWILHKLTDESWKDWRHEHPKDVAHLKEQISTTLFDYKHRES